jgi:hypothetical protein
LIENKWESNEQAILKDIPEKKTVKNADDQCWVDKIAVTDGGGHTDPLELL